MIENCPNCGGIHYGSTECPYKSPPQIERAISVEKTRQMLAQRQAIDSGPNPSYDPKEDAIDAIAEHLREDDSAYADGDEAERQARRIADAIQQRGLQIVHQTDWVARRRDALTEAATVVTEVGREHPQRMALCMTINNQIVALMDND